METGSTTKGGLQNAKASPQAQDLMTKTSSKKAMFIFGMIGEWYELI